MINLTLQEKINEYYQKNGGRVAATKESRDGLFAFVLVEDVSREGRKEAIDAHFLQDHSYLMGCRKLDPPKDGHYTMTSIGGKYRDARCYFSQIKEIWPSKDYSGAYWFNTCPFDNSCVEFFSYYRDDDSLYP